MIIIFGSVGSGKSEQAIRLSSDLNCQRLSSSSILKENQNPEIQQRMLNGELVDDETVIGLLEKEFEKISADKTEFIMDGFPRSVKQAEWFLEKVKDKKIMFTGIFKLEVSKEVVIKRLLSRGRDDDNEAIISKRLEVYESVTNPVIDYLRDNGIEVDEINGELSIDEVHKQIMGILNNKK